MMAVYNGRGRDVAVCVSEQDLHDLESGSVKDLDLSPMMGRPFRLIVGCLEGLHARKGRCFEAGAIAALGPELIRRLRGEEACRFSYRCSCSPPRWLPFSVLFVREEEARALEIVKAKARGGVVDLSRTPFVAAPKGVAS